MSLSLANMLFDETRKYHEKMLRESIHTIIARQMESAQRCMPDYSADKETVFLYSFIVGPLLDSLTKRYVNWDEVNVLNLYDVMFFWRPDARPLSYNQGMTDKFLHDWNICRDRLLNYGLVFPSSN